MRHSTPLAVAMAVLATLAIGVDGTQATEKISQTPIVPSWGEKYPYGTPITGPCKPTTPPSGSGTVTRTHAWASFVDPSYDSIAEHPAYTHSQAIKPEGHFSDGPCRAQEYNDPFNNVAVLGNGVPGFRATDPGQWTMYPVQTTTTWEYDDQDGFDWVDVSSGGEHRFAENTRFQVYDPCHFRVTGVSGRVLKGRPGRRLQTVRTGTLIGRGETLTVQNDGRTPGRVTLSGDAGNDLGFGAGEYQFTDNEACKKLVQGRWPARLPQQPVHVEVKKGGVEQRSDEVRSSVKAGKDLWNDGILSKQGRHRPRAAQAGEDPVEISFKVTRNKRKRVTLSCAREGRLRVRTTNKAVPKRKRKLILRAGQCAKTKDGKAPRRVRR